MKKLHFQFNNEKRTKNNKNNENYRNYRTKSYNDEKKLDVTKKHKLQKLNDFF